MTTDAQRFDELPHDTQVARLTEIAQAALGHWTQPFEIVRLLKYRENAVFEVATPQEQRGVLRLHRTGYHDRTELLSELAWMTALADAGVAVPQVVPARDGGLLVEAASPDDASRRYIDLLSWVDGEALADLDPADTTRRIDLYWQVGALAASLHDHGCHWQRPQGFKRKKWDADGLVGEEPVWGRFWEFSAQTSAQAALLSRFRSTAALALERIGKGNDLYGLIHADLVAENVLATPEQLNVIDFDDCGEGWFLFELSTALFFLMDDPSYPEIRAALLSGYTGARAVVVDLEVDLNLFLALRASTYVGWVMTRPETETARTMTNFIVERACALAEAYLAGARLEA